jgi:hypothetical protein
VGGGGVSKGHGRVNMVQTLVHIYVNGKLVPVETIPEWGVGGIKENDGRGELSMIYLIYCKNFYKCHNIFPASIKIKKKLK